MLSLLFLPPRGPSKIPPMPPPPKSIAETTTQQMRDSLVAALRREDNLRTAMLKIEKELAELAPVVASLEEALAKLDGLPELEITVEELG